MAQVNASVFGNYNIKLLKNSDIITGIALNVINIEDTLYNICISILNGNDTSFNKLYIDKIILTLTANPDAITGAILRAINDATNTMYEQIQQCPKIKNILDAYNKININTGILKDVLAVYDNSIEFTNKNKSMITYMKNLCIYNNIINRYYNYNDTQIYFYDIISKLIADNTIEINELINIIKIYQFYNRFSIMADINITFKNTFFNKKLSDKMQRLSSPEIIQIITAKLDNIIRELAICEKKELMQKMINHIRDIITCCMQVYDKTQFMKNYITALNERIYNYKTNIELENEILRLYFTHQDNPELYAKMKYTICDALMSSKHVNAFKTLTVRQKSEKYKNYDLTSFDKNICKFLILRKFAFDAADITEETYTPPDIVNIFIAIFNGYYSNNFKDNSLVIMHGKSTGVLEMMLRDKKLYNIKMTLPQMYIILLISENDTLTAQAMSDKLNITLKTLGRILNSLIECSLIERNEGAEDDITLQFYINYSCYFDETHTDITHLYNKWITLHQNTCILNIDDAIQSDKKDKAITILL